MDDPRTWVGNFWDRPKDAARLERLEKLVEWVQGGTCDVGSLVQSRLAGSPPLA